MNTYPFNISIVFCFTTLLTFLLFYKAIHKPKYFIYLALLWLTVQGVLGAMGFYLITDIIPLRFLLLVMPPIIFIICLFITKKGKACIDGLDLKFLTLLHIVRIPVEFVLFWIFLNKGIPKLMTFEGINFDIISGISAPIIYYIVFVKNKFNRNAVLAWNILCLFLLFNIVYHAIFSAPSPFQKFAFEQPNQAILYFPFIWLPSFIVPLVLFSHLASIRKLLKK